MSKKKNKYIQQSKAASKSHQLSENFKKIKTTFNLLRTKKKTLSNNFHHGIFSLV